MSRFPTLSKTIITDFCLVLFSVVVAVRTLWPSFVNPYTIHNDARQHIYWLYRFRDPSLLRDDILTDFSEYFQHHGTAVIYKLLSFVMDPILISKVLPVILFPVATYFVIQVARHIGRENTAFIAGFSFVLSPLFLETMTGGFGRAFAFPLLAAFFSFSVRQRYAAASVVVLLCALFYPILFSVTALALGCLFLRETAAGRRLWRQGTLFLVSCAAGAANLASRIFVQGREAFGYLVTRADMLGQPEFYEGGRYALLPVPPLTDVLAENMLKGAYIPGVLAKLWSALFPQANPILVAAGFLGLFLALLGAEFFRRPKSVLLPFALVFISACVMFTLADRFLLQLVLPTRYLEYTLPLIVLILIAVTTGGILDKMFSQRRQPAVLAVLTVFFLATYTPQPAALQDLSARKDLYSFLARLPKDSLIAAHPDLASNIPLFSQRKVYIQYELSLPFFNRYWQEIKSRTYRFFAAYYAQDLSRLTEFCTRNGIDYVVVDRRHFSPDYLKGRVYFEPFGSWVREYVGARRSFAVTEIPDEVRLYEHGPTFVVSASDLEQLTNKGEKRGRTFHGRKE